MPYIEIYTKKKCPYCEKAKKLLITKSLNFKEISIDNDQNNKIRSEMYKRSGRTTVPQIFINGTHIGGSDDLHVLNEQGKLNYFCSN